MGLTPPTKMVFRLSMAIWIFALLMYFVSIFTIGFMATCMFAYWFAMIAWAVLAAGVAFKTV